MPKFIDRKWLVIILLIALIEPLHYFLLINYPPDGKAFMAYDSDEAMVSGVMRSVELNFDNPWSKGEKVFFNGALGSPYPYLPLGYIRLLLGIDAILMNIISKFIFFFLFLLTLFKTMEALMPRRHELAFIFFVVPLGLMPIGYFLGFATGMERLAEGFSFEFSVISNISRVYYFVPLITGLLSLLFISKGRKKECAVALGLTFFFYPFFGFAFSGLAFLYIISGKNGPVYEKIKQSLGELWRPYIIAALFLLPWLYVRFAHSEYFTLYSQNSAIWRAHLTGLLGSYFFLFAIILIANIGTTKRYWKFLTFGGLLSFIIILFELKGLGVLSTTLPIPMIALDVIELLLIAMFATAWFVLKSQMDRKLKFIILFAMLFFPLSILNPKYAFWMQYRMGYILHIPLAMLAAIYFDSFVEKMKGFGIKKTFVITVLAIFAVSSFLAYNYRFQMADRRTDNVYFEADDKDAMIFLNGQEAGTVLASGDTNYFIPVWSGKYALYHPAESQYMGGGPDRENKKTDVAAFYSGNLTEETTKAMLQRYDIRYVFYGSREKELGSLNLDSYKFLEKIYDNQAQIYRVLL